MINAYEYQTMDFLSAKKMKYLQIDLNLNGKKTDRKKNGEFVKDWICRVKEDNFIRQICKNTNKPMSMALVYLSKNLSKLSIMYLAHYMSCVFNKIRPSR